MVDVAVPMKAETSKICLPLLDSGHTLYLKIKIEKK